MILLEPSEKTYPSDSPPRPAAPALVLAAIVEVTTMGTVMLPSTQASCDFTWQMGKHER